jgi:hypothetical protein
MGRISAPARDRMARPVLGLPLTAASLTSEAALSLLRLLAFNEFKQLTAYSSFCLLRLRNNTITLIGIVPE